MQQISSDRGLSRRGLKEKLEVLTNIMVLLAVPLFGFVVYRSFIAPPASGTTHAEVPIVGTALPVLPGYNWSGHNETLVLAIRKDCHFCEDSLPFYRELLKAQKNGESKAYVIGVLPDEAALASQMLQQAQLDVPVVAPFSLRQLHISDTPTLVLVDRNGKVEKTWVGEQQPSGQREILDAIRN